LNGRKGPNTSLRLQELRRWICHVDGRSTLNLVI
jgi:hypothetical protein